MAVDRAFDLLKLKPLSVTPGEADHRRTFNDLRIVAETKGRETGIKKSDARQLEDWVSSEHFGDDDEAEAKGILVGNAWRLTAPEDREAAFSPNVVDYSTPRGHCLITTVQLLDIVEDVLEDESRAEAHVKNIMKTSGVYVPLTPKN